jgi:hypothetical protein
MLVDIISLLKYPVSNIKRFLVAALINTFWFLVIPIFFINGYVVRVIRSTIKEEPELPAWDNWKEILKHGFILSVIMLAYILIPMVFTYIAVTVGNLPSPTDMATAGTLPQISAVAMVFLILSSLSLIFIAFIMPMVMLVYSASEELKQAFNIPLILEKIMANIFSYIKACVLSLAGWVIFLLLFPFISFAAGFVMAYPSIFSAHVFAKSFKEVI